MTTKMADKTEQWYRERPARVAAMVEEARRRGRISPRLVHDALGEVGGYSPDLSHVLLVASVLGEQLSTREFLGLLRDAKDHLEGAVRYEFERAEAPIASRLSVLQDREEREAISDQSIKELRSYGEGQEPHVARAALVMQALVWAICPPTGGP